MIAVSTVTYRIKDVGKDADYFRDLARSTLGADALVEVHPGIVRFRFLAKLSKDQVGKLDKVVAEVAEGVRVE